MGNLLGQNLVAMALLTAAVHFISQDLRMMNLHSLEERGKSAGTEILASLPDSNNLKPEQYTS